MIFFNDPITSVHLRCITIFTGYEWVEMQLCEYFQGLSHLYYKHNSTSHNNHISRQRVGDFCGCTQPHEHLHHKAVRSNAFSLVAEVNKLKMLKTPFTPVFCIEHMDPTCHYEQLYHGKVLQFANKAAITQGWLIITEFTITSLKVKYVWNFLVNLYRHLDVARFCSACGKTESLIVRNDSLLP